MTVVINGDTGISPVTASGTSASVDGMTVGRGGGEVAQNTVVGANAGVANTTGKITAVGYLAARFNTTGSGNTALGGNDAAQDGALYYNTTGNYNIAVGTGSVASNTTGSSNTGIGYSALQNNTTASNNTAVGYQALYSFTGANGSCTALGYQAGYGNTTGVYQTLVGFQAGYTGSADGGDTFVGYKSGYYKTTSSDVYTTTLIGSFAGQNTSSGVDLVAVGGSALQANTTGGKNVAIGAGALTANTTASNGVAVGYQAGLSNTTSPDNVFMGNKAGYSTSTGGGSNTFIGQQAGYSHTTGQNNQFFGGGAGYYISTGSKNTIIGAYTGNQGGLDIRTSSNYIVLSDGDGNPRLVGDNVGGVGINTTGGGGYWFKVYATNMTANYGMAIQNGTAANGGYFINFLNSSGNPAGYINQTGTTTVNYTASSDYRMKENITPLTGGLEKVLKLNPVTYTWKDDGGVGEGFIAHDLQKHIPLAVSGEKDEIDDKGNPKYQGVDYGKITTTLVLAIQELKAEFDAYKATHP